MRAALVLALCAAGFGCDVVGLGGGDQYEGEFSGTMGYAVTNTPGVTCSSTLQITGRVELELERSSIDVTGEGTITVTEVGGPASPTGCGPGPSRHWDGSGPIQASSSDFMTLSHSYTGTGAITVTTNSMFSGSFAGDVITGLVTISHQGQGVIGASNVTEGGTGSYNVTLRR